MGCPTGKKDAIKIKSNDDSVIILDDAGVKDYLVKFKLVDNAIEVTEGCDEYFSNILHNDDISELITALNKLRKQIK